MTTAIPMVHIRTFTLQTLVGHSIAFKGPNEPVMVPPEAIQEAMRAGAAPASEVHLPDNSGVRETKAEIAAKAPTGDARDELIRQAMREMIGENASDDFDANGAPKLRRLSAKTGFKVEQDERNTLWQEVRIELNDE